MPKSVQTQGWGCTAGVRGTEAGEFFLLAAVRHEAGSASQLTPNHHRGCNSAVPYFNKVRPKHVEVIDHFLYHDLKITS